MKKILFILLFISQIAFGQGDQTTINVPYNGSGGTRQALLHLPNEYADSTSKKYPIFIFLHGQGEAGSPISKIYNSSGAGGPAYFIAQNQWTDSFMVNGKEFKPIVLSPQDNDFSVSKTEIEFVINYMYTNYRVDTNRLYFLGLSAGGQTIIEYNAKVGISPQHRPPASVIMSMAYGQPPQSTLNATIADSIHTWGFGSMTDAMGISTRCYVEGAFSGNCGSLTGLGALGRFTTYSGGHCCWNQFYNPTYTENIGGVNMNIYQWLLQYTRDTSTAPPPPPDNLPPVADAGEDQSITLPTNSITMTGGATDADGTIASKTWSKVSGGSATITTPTSYTTTITGLVAGTYLFRLSVTDNDGATDTDDMIVTVNAESGESTTDTVNVNLYGSASYSNSEWNNWQTTSSLTKTSNTYAGGAASTMVFTLSAQTGYSDNGGSYPVTVMSQQVGRDASYSTGTRTLTISGLDNGNFYDIKLLGTRSNNGQFTTYSISGEDIQINTYLNYTNLATFINKQPTGGSIVITISSTNGGTYNYLNAVTVIEKNPPIPPNVLPVANAGADQTITLPTNSVTMAGSANDEDGVITSNIWTQISGTTATITNPTSYTTTITGLAQGTNVFRLTVTDDSAAVDYDDVTITVNAEPSDDTTLIKVGVGEYFTSYLKSNGKLSGTVWGGNYGVSRDTTIDFAPNNVRWTSGGQYRCIYINSGGSANPSTTDTVGLVYKDNAAGGSMGLQKFALDSTGARFDSISKAYVWFQTFLAIRKGELYYWGYDGESYGALQLKGSGSAYNILKPFKLGQPGGGRKITDVNILTDYGTPAFTVLCDDGSVWTYSRGSAIPVQKSGLSNIIKLGAISRNVVFAVKDNDMLVYGGFTATIGLSEPITTPTSVYSMLVNAGVAFPIKEIGNNYNTMILIDADDSLWVWGDSPQGEGGTELNPYRSLSFSWSFTRNQKLIGITNIRGKYKNLCSSGNLAFDFFIQDLNNNWYAWGRDKNTAQGSGEQIANADTYPQWRNKPYPRSVDPLTVTWLSGGGPTFNPNDSLPPVANAGVNRDVTTSADSLYGDWSTQQEHQIASYSWSKISGTGGTISSPSSRNTAVTGLTTGTYVYRVTVTNTHGESDTDDVTLHVELNEIPPVIRGNRIPGGRLRKKN